MLASVRLVLFLWVVLGAAAGGGPSREEIEARIAALRSGSSQEQIVAARWLAMNAPEAGLRDLMDMSRHPEATREVRDVLRVMAWIAERPKRLRFRTEDAVLEAIADERPVTRAAGVRHLFYLGMRGDRDRTLAALDDPAPDVRAAGLEVLGYWDEAVTAERVLPLLDDPDPGVRRQALVYAGRHTGVDLVDAVARRLGDEDAMVRQEARWVLQGMGRPVDPDVHAALAVGLADPRPEVVVRFLEEYGKVLSRDERPPGWEQEIGAFLAHEVPAVRLRSAELMLGGAPDRAVPVLLGLLSAPSPAVRADAAEALAVAKIDVSEADVAGLMADPDAAVGHAGVGLARGLPSAAARRLVREVVGSDAPADTRAGAVLLLADVGTAEDLARLIEIYPEAPDLVRANVIQSAGLMETRLETGLVAPWLRGILEDDAESTAIHAAVARTVDQVGDETYLPVLARRLRETDDVYITRNFSRAISILLGRRAHGPEFAR